MTQTPSLHTKLAQVMYEAERIPKRGRAPAAMGGFEFVQVGDAADVIRKALAEHKVSMIPTAIELISEAEHETKAGGTMTMLTVRTTWTLTDGDTGETATIQSMGSGADSGDKAIPKAQTNAMKYALLMGFLLSTGDDPEGVIPPERKARDRVDSHQSAEADEESAYPVGNWSALGTAKIAKAPVDGNLRETPEGPLFGFVIETADKKHFQVVAEGDLALPVSLVWESLKGQSVRVSGPTELVPWTKKVDGNVRNMPPYRRIHATRIESGELIIPAPPDGPLREIEEDAANEAFHDALSELSEDEETELDIIAQQLPL
jgi:hypothetical protein